MAPARSIRQRVVNNENDENATIRLTRAKSAARGGPDDMASGAVKKALQTKKPAVNSLVPAQRKRPALGDVSNVTKAELVDLKDGKKMTAAKATLLSKASQNAGIQKLSRTTSTRSALGTKDHNKKTTTAELKRPASGSGIMGAVPKRRSTGPLISQSAAKDSTPAADSASSTAKTVHVEAVIENNVEEITRSAKVEVEVEVEPSVDATADVESEDEVQDLDADDFDDPLMVAEYAVDIFEYLRELEQQTMPNERYMQHQDHIDWEEREILTDWLIQVHIKFGLLPETLYLTINIIDRFLSTKVVQLEKLQLVGITAMFIASKYEEILSPHISNFSYIAKDYADSEILAAERFILSTLNYDLSYPNPMNFLRRISKADNYDMQTRAIGKYLLEISVCDQRFMEFCPSHLAAAAMYMARLILDKGPWDATLAHYAGYTEDEILPVFQLMVDYCSAPVRHQALHNKYASKKYIKASLIVRLWSKKNAALYLEGLAALVAPSIEDETR